MAQLRSDRVVSVITKNGKFRAAAINNTQSAKTAVKKHNLGFLPALWLARQLSAASLIAVFMKGEERVVLDTDGSGPIRKVYAEAIQVGEVRGFVVCEPEIDLALMTDISDALGKGFYRVSKIQYDKPEPTVGVTELQKGNISTDLAYYFTQSEQIPTGVILDVVFDEAQNITASGGIIVQAMPGATEAEIAFVRTLLQEKGDIKEELTAGLKPEEIISSVLPFEFDILKNDRVDFFCRCSKQKFMDKLVTLSLKEIIDMSKSGHNELVCQYCNSHYYLDQSDFEKLIAIMQAKQN